MSTKWTPGIETKHWTRLQQTSINHALSIGPRKSWRQHVPPQDIRDNCDILGRGSEEEIKARLLWYLTYYPQHWVGSR